VVISLERGADLHMAQLMSLPLTVSCFSKIQIGFTFLVPAYPGSPGQRAVKRVCVCVCVCVTFLKSFYPRDAMIARLLSYGQFVRRSVITSWCSIESSGRIELILGMQTSFNL